MTTHKWLECPSGHETRSGNQILEVSYWRNCTATDNSTKERKLFSQQAYVLSTVEGNPKLLDLLEIATSSAQKTLFIKFLLDVLSITSHFAQLDKTPVELFDVFTAWSGTHSNTRLQMLSHLIFSRLALSICCQEVFISFLDQDYLHFQIEKPLSSKIQLNCII